LLVLLILLYKKSKACTKSQRPVQKVKGKTLGGLAAPQTPTLLKIKAKPWALPKPTREIISLDP
jgi:hypothetical protein